MVIHKKLSMAKHLLYKRFQNSDNLEAVRSIPEIPPHRAMLQCNYLSQTTGSFCSTDWEFFLHSFIDWLALFVTASDTDTKQNGASVYT